ncbi:hypothetical protein TNCV_2827941 [Trichonephila clavipes]|nr:hypothetical protein TNCV_2827941 [Trichonephila clavipes]
MIMTARPNCDYLVSIEWMRYQRQWVPYRICNSHSFMEEDESWDRNDIVRVPQEELEQFIKFHLLKDYLERENHGWDLVIAATDLAIYMYLDRIIP